MVSPEPARSSWRGRGEDGCPGGWRAAENQQVRLEIQTSPRSRDRYSRLLAYVSGQSDNLLVNKEIIRQGYGHAYTKYPFDPARMDEFRAAERSAREQKRGLWASGDHR